MHRFIVRDTVEERIQNLLKTKSGNDLLRYAAYYR